MCGIARGMKFTAECNGARWIANSIVCNQIQRGTKLSFVFDFISGSTAGFSSLRYTLDAARAPLHTDLTDEEFLMVYGLSRKLSFKVAAPRKVSSHDIWAGIYD